MKKHFGKIKIRKSLRNFYLVVLLVIILLCLYVLYDAFNSTNKKNLVKASIYEYNNKYEYSCDVNLSDNKFVEKDNVAEDNVYITDLMNNVDINMKYEYKANQASDINYNYQVRGYLEATYSNTKDGKEQKVWQKSYALVPNKEMKVSSDSFTIDESFNVNFAEIVQEIKGFQEELGMNVDVKYMVFMGINSDTVVLGKDVANIYSPDIVFDIGNKTTTISTTTENSERPQVVTKTVEQNQTISNVKKSVATVTAIISSVLILFILIKTTNKNSVRNEYKIEFNKILKGCEEKLVESKTKIDIEGNNVVDVNDFTEVLKVSEELFKPILYWSNENTEETWFCVLGDNTVYRFILKR